MNTKNIISILNEFNLNLDKLFMLMNNYSYELYKEIPKDFYEEMSVYLESTLNISNKFKGQFEGDEELSFGKFLIKSLKCDLISNLYLALELIENYLSYEKIEDIGIAFLNSISFKMSGIISSTEKELEDLILSHVFKVKKEKVEDHSKILLFDQDKIYSKNLKKYLVSQRYKVVLVKSFSEFEKLLYEDFYDLIIIDFISFDQEGLIIKLIQNLKKDGVYKKIPIIVMSEIEKKEFVKTFIEEKAEDYFFKNLDFSILNARIKNSIYKKKVRDREQKYLELILESREYLESEIIEAGNYVESLLPKKIRNNIFDTNWIFAPSKKIGGDFFNYYFINDNEVMIYLIDISGHGVGSALLSLSVANIINFYVINQKNDISPSKILEYVNDYFYKFKSEMFITLWCGVLNTSTKSLKFSSAGSPPALVISSKGISKLGTDGLVLGIEEDREYHEQTFSFEDKSHLLLFSDGVYEVENKNNAIMNINDFYSILEKNLFDPKNFVLEKIYKAILDISEHNVFRDDFSLLEFIIH